MHSDGPPERFAFWLFSDALQLEADACGLPVEEFSNALNQLIAEGWAEYVFTRNGNRSGVKLTHNGVHYKEYLRREMVRYLADKWVDILALVVAAAAFIQSCIALAN